jgi:hypothetical protein
VAPISAASASQGLEPDMEVMDMRSDRCHTRSG